MTFSAYARTPRTSDTNTVMNLGTSHDQAIGTYLQVCDN